MTKKVQDVDRADLLRLVLDASNAVKQQITATLADAELTEPMITMLWALQPSNAMSMKDLATKLNYDPSNISLLGDRMESMGLVERKPHPTDGRRKVLTLTADGDAMYERMLDTLFEASPIFSLDEAEQAQLAGLLKKVEQAGTRRL